MTAMKKASATPDRAPLWNRSFCTLLAVNFLMSLTMYATNSTFSLHLGALGFAPASIGMLISLMSFASMTVRPVSGWICDRGSQRMVLLGCIGLMGVIMTGYALSRSMALFVLLRVLHGAVFSVNTTLTMAMSTAFIPRSRLGEGVGYFGVSLSLAAAAGPWLSLSISSAWSFQALYLCMTALMGLTALMAASIRPPAREEAARKGRIHLRDFICAAALPYALMTIGLSASNGVETSYIAAYAQSVGIDDIGWYFTISAATLFATRLLLGRASDHLRFIWILIPSTLLIVTALVLLSSASDASSWPLFAMAACIKALGVGTLQPALQAMCLRSTDAAHRGAASGTYYIGTDFGQGSATALAGRILETHSYSQLYLLTCIPLLVIPFICSFFGRRKKHDEKAC